jgi:hypothetical protein
MGREGKRKRGGEQKGEEGKERAVLSKYCSLETARISFFFSILDLELRAFNLRCSHQPYFFFFF